MDFPRRFGPYVAIVIVLGLAMALAGHFFGKRMMQRGAAAARVERDTATIRVLRDSLASSRAAVVVAQQRATGKFAAYDSARSRVVVKYRTRTDTVNAPPDTVIEVRREYIAAADSLRQECAVLATECARYRMHADSSLAAYERTVKTLLETPPPPARRWGVGAFAGGCLPGAKPCAGLGFTLRIF